jgi:hypothetical protein
MYIPKYQVPSTKYSAPWGIMSLNGFILPQETIRLWMHVAGNFTFLKQEISQQAEQFSQFQGHPPAL